MTEDDNKRDNDDLRLEIDFPENEDFAGEATIHEGPAHDSSDQDHIDHSHIDTGVRQNDEEDDLSLIERFAKEDNSLTDDEIDMDGDDDFAFDAPVKKRGGGLKKIAAPLIVLALAAGGGGYIIMNPDIVSGLTGGGSKAPVRQFAAAPVLPEQPVLPVVEAPVPATQDESSLADAYPDEPVMPYGAMDESAPVQAVDENINENMVAGDVSPVPRGPEGSDISVVDAAVPAIPALDDSAPAAVATDDTESTASDNAHAAIPPTPAPDVLAQTDQPVVDMSGESITDSATTEFGSADDAQDDEQNDKENDVLTPVQTVPAEEAQAPAMPPALSAPETQAQPVANNAAAPAPASANANANDNPQAALGMAAPAGATRGANDYYDSGIDLPRGVMAKETMRVADPTLEPAQKMVIARKDYGQSSQEALLESANRALKLQRYEAALELYEQLYARNRRDPRILMGLAVAQQYAGRPESAIQSYEALLDIDPRNADAMVNMLGLLQQQYPEVALRRLLDLQDKFPNNAGIAAQIGVTQAGLGHYEDAVRYMQMAASLDPRNAQHLFNLAVIADRRGVVADAIKYYEAALETDAVYGGGRTLSRETIYDRLATLRRR